MSDVLTGTNMAAAVMAGLLKRGVTGCGCVIGTSQTQALPWLQLHVAGVAANLGQRVERFDPFATANPLFTVYRTADGWVAIAVLQPQQYPVVANAVGLGHRLDDPRFATLDDVMANRQEFRLIFAEHLAADGTDRWWRALRAVDAWVSPVNRLEDLATDPDIVANEYLVEFDDGFVGPPVPFEVDGFLGVRGVAAEYGEHTDEILDDLGYGDEERLQLRIDGAVW